MEEVDTASISSEDAIKRLIDDFKKTKDILREAWHFRKNKDISREARDQIKNEFKDLEREE